MFTSFRSMTKSTIGTIVLALFGIMIVASFALADLSGLGVGAPTMSGNTLVKVGSLEVNDREMDAAMQRRLAQVRQQNPEADYASLASEFDPLLQSLIDQRTLQAFARKHGFVVSKRLIDAEIANIPGVKGLNGQFSQQSYEAFLSRQRMTDAEVRDIIEGELIRRLLLTPAASNPKVPIGMATPYASMLLEQREGDVAVVPISAFTAGLNPSDAQLQQFYGANQSRYMIPEQRVIRIARIGPEQVASVTATDAEIARYHQANQATYGAKDIRVISQVVVPDRNVASQIAARAKGGQSFVEAARPAGFSAADVSVGPQTRAEFTDLAGERVAAAAFGAASGAVVGPIQSDLGWHVVKVDSVERQAGRSLAQARSEIAEKITAEKRQNALADLHEKVQTAIDNGANFNEAAQAGGLTVTTTPLITAAGVDRSNPAFKLDSVLAPAIRTGFELGANDEPIIEQLGSESDFAMVAPAEIVPAAAAPLASIRDRVRTDWIQNQATQMARAAATRIANAASGQNALAEAAKQAGRPLPPVQKVGARRIQISEMGDQVPEPLRLLFTVGQGKARAAADPQSRGFFVVKTTKIVPGNALNQPRLIGQVRSEFEQPLAQEYAQQFLAAARKALNVRRNEEAIAATKKRLLTGG